MLRGGLAEGHLLPETLVTVDQPRDEPEREGSRDDSQQQAQELGGSGAFGEQKGA